MSMYACVWSTFISMFAPVSVCCGVCGCVCVCVWERESVFLCALGLERRTCMCPRVVVSLCEIFACKYICIHDVYLCARIVCLSVRLSVRLPVFLLAFMYAFACTYAFLPICLNVCRMSACISVCLPAFFVYTPRPRSTASKGVVFVCLHGCVCFNLL